MGDDAGGAASQLPQTSASLPPRPCAGCSMPFVPKTNNPDEKYCTKKCLKLFKTQQQPARQSARRRHSLNNTLPGTPQLVGEAGSKRPLSPTCLLLQHQSLALPIKKEKEKTMSPVFSLPCPESLFRRWVSPILSPT